LLSQKQGLLPKRALPARQPRPAEGPSFARRRRLWPPADLLTFDSVVLWRVASHGRSASRIRRCRVATRPGFGVIEKKWRTVFGQEAKRTLARSARFRFGFSQVARFVSFGGVSDFAQLLPPQWRRLGARVCL